MILNTKSKAATGKKTGSCDKNEAPKQISSLQIRNSLVTTSILTYKNYFLYT